MEPVPVDWILIEQRARRAISYARAPGPSYRRMEVVESKPIHGFKPVQHMKIRSLFLLTLLLPLFGALHAEATTGTDQVLRAQSPANASSIELTIRISPQLLQKTRPGDPVFIYAKAIGGPPMPLAAVRKRVSDLPLTITLDDSMAMLPQLRLSAFKQVVVGARISMTGNAKAQPGDLQGEVSPVTPGRGGPVEIVIDSVFPLSAT
jgi:hypothetical protein